MAICVPQRLAGIASVAQLADRTSSLVARFGDPRGAGFELQQVERPRAGNAEQLDVFAGVEAGEESDQGTEGRRLRAAVEAVPHRPREQRSSRRGEELRQEPAGVAGHPTRQESDSGRVVWGLYALVWY